MDDINITLSTDTWLHHTHSIKAATELPHGTLWHPNKAITHTPILEDHSPPPSDPPRGHVSL